MTKKLLFVIVAFLGASGLFAQENMYLPGSWNGNSWNFTDYTKFTKNADGSWTKIMDVSEMTGVQEFKIAQSWGSYEYGWDNGNGGPQTLVAGTITKTNRSDDNWKIDVTDYDVLKFTITGLGSAEGVTLSVDAPLPEELPVYMRGEIPAGNWTPQESNAMTRVDDWTYTVTTAISGTKSIRISAGGTIGEDSWMDTNDGIVADFRSNGSECTLDNLYRLNGESGGNIPLNPGDATKVKITLVYAGSMFSTLYMEEVGEEVNPLTVPVYLRGLGYGFAIAEDSAFEQDATDEFVYTKIIDVRNLTGEQQFLINIGGKIGVDDNSVDRFGSNGTAVEAGTLYRMGLNNGNAMVDVTDYDFLKLTFTYKGSKSTLLVEPLPVKDVYLMGSVMGWTALEEWKFQPTSTYDVYELKDKELSGVFKIADSNYSQINLGSSGEQLQINTLYRMAQNGEDIDLGRATWTCSKITLDLRDNTVLFEGTEHLDTDELTTVYIMGHNGWNWTDESGALRKDDADGLYKGTVEFTNGSSEVYWRIFEGLNQVGTWGLEGGNATQTALSGKFVKGATGNACVAPGTYEVVFNIETGDYALTAAGTDAVAALKADGVRVEASNGEIRVSGAATVRVYTLSGALMGEAARMSVPSGLYIVEADSKVMKVVVK